MRYKYISLNKGEKMTVLEQLTENISNPTVLNYIYGSITQEISPEELAKIVLEYYLDETTGYQTEFGDYLYYILTDEATDEVADILWHNIN